MRQSDLFSFASIAIAWLLASCSSPAPGAPDYGAACSGACAGGLLCVTGGPFEGGYCSRDCTSNPCGEGALCDRSTSPPLCLDVCATGSECRPGYQCWAGACRPACSGDSECGAGARCGSDGHCAALECTGDEACGPAARCESGACVPREGIDTDAGAERAPIGGACASDGECASGICLPAELGGVCTIGCSRRADCIGIATGFSAACAPVMRGAIETICVAYREAGLIGAACDRDDQCRASTCVEGQCTEPCRDGGDCLSGQVCGAVARAGGSFQGCGYVPRTGEIETIDLGEFELGAASGTEELAIAVPRDSVSLTLRAETVSGDPLPLSFVTIADPRGDTLFDLDEIVAWHDVPARWYPQDSQEAIALTIPNATGDRIEYVGGAYRFHVAALRRFDTDRGSCRVRVSGLVKRAPSAPVRGALDLDLYLVGVGLGSTTAPGSERIVALLDRFEEILGRAGIAVGDVAFHDVASEDATRYAIIESTQGPDSELAGLFRLSAGITPPMRLPIFLVRSIEAGGDGFHTLGIAGGIPGAIGIHGTSHSGVVVTFDPDLIGGRAAGHVMAHETSHFLGLYHVTEFPRPCGDEEMSSDCVPFGGTDVIDDTRYGDEDNLMNWSVVGGGENDTLSPGQGYVLLRNALVGL